jgi:surface carbohydrate biosynthesis protein (TIGR04326 family)
MSTVILANRLRPLQDHLTEISEPIRYLNLEESLGSSQIDNYLRQLSNVTELPKSQLFRQYGKNFLDKYRQLMAQLNARNHSLHWWAMPFTDKNALLRPCFNDIAQFLLIVELAHGNAGLLLVITESADLSAQVQAWAGQKGIKIHNLYREPWSWRRFLKRHSPAGVVNVVIRTALLWFLSRRYRPKRNQRDSHLVIATLTHPRSFSSPKGYEDAYFGSLVDHVAASDQDTVILTQVIERPLAQLKQLKSLKFGIPIVPVESCLNFQDISACAYHAFKKYLWPTRGLQGPIQIDELDVSCLVKRVIVDTCRSGNFFMSLRMYYGAKRLAQTVRTTLCLFPYENRSWEKMVLIGMRSVSPNIQMVGYQHASVTVSHTNLLLQDSEADLTPLPSRILTTGEIVKGWLERDGNYPPGTIKAGCALRQSQSIEAETKRRKPQLNHVLVALATNIGEYVRILIFLEAAFSSSDHYTVRVRPHPAFTLESALNVAPLNRRDFFSPSTGPLSEDLEWADVVLYASSTVGLEAVSLGIPVVHLDVGDFLETDPILGWDEFKWSVREPSKLISTLKNIEAIPDAQFSELQQRGKKYSAAYLSPVTLTVLRSFYET